MLRDVPPPDELARAGAEHVGEAAVRAYDRKSQFDPSDDLDELRGRGLDRGTTLIDFGAGTGTFALAAAHVARRVVAVDVSPAMVAEIRKRAADGRVTNLEAVQAGFLTYKHDGPPADFAYTRNALHHLPDFWQGVALTRLAAVLPVGGILFLRDIVFSFELHEADRFLSEWLAGAAERPEDGWTRAEFIEHVRNEHSTFSWVLEPMLEQAGFEIEHVQYGRARAYAAYVCKRRSATPAPVGSPAAAV